MLLALALVLACAAPAAAGQLLPEGPVRVLDGRVAIGGEVSVTLGEPDSDAFFNYTDYERNVLRMFRVSLAAAWQPAERIALLGEIRSQDLDDLEATGAYLRVRPWKSIPLDVQAGRIPPVFGSFARQSYGKGNLLIGYPLAYQYLTSLRSDALPASTDDLLRMRGRGWQTSFPIGSPLAAPGLPLVSAFRWDTGVQVRWSGAKAEAAGAVTLGTLSNPRTTDDNGGKQVSGRIAVQPLVGLRLGGSAAYGEWLDEDVVALLTPAARTRYDQQAYGVDIEYSRGYWLVRAEAVLSRWELPPIQGAGGPVTLSALGAWVEARYRVTPRIFIAGRADRLGFSTISGALSGGLPTEWDAPIHRFEAGGGYLLQRNLVGRIVVQHNDRDGGRVHRRTLLSAQVTYWF